MVYIELLDLKEVVLCDCMWMSVPRADPMRSQHSIWSSDLLELKSATLIESVSRAYINRIMELLYVGGVYLQAMLLMR